MSSVPDDPVGDGPLFPKDILTGQLFTFHRHFRPMARVVIENLCKSFPGSRKADPVWAVRDLSLDIADGEFLVLVGPSGCGKSTTLRLVAGLEDITSGIIRIGDQVVNDIEPKDRDIAMVFQNYALYPHMTVYENMAFGLQLRKLPRDEIRSRVAAAATMLGLDGLLDRLPKALSGGQRQRVALGRAIVRQPKVFLFDEPLSNLDAQMRLQMRTELAKLHHQLKATMIYVTHDQAEAMTLGDRIVVMKDGLLQQAADPVTLYQRPSNRFVASFIGSPPMNFFPGNRVQSEAKEWFVQTDSTGEFSPFRFALDAAPSIRREVVLGLRPEHLSDHPGEGTVVLEGRIELVELMGAETFVHLSRGTERFVARVPFLVRRTIGERLTLYADVRHACFFDPVSGLAIRP